MKYMEEAEMNENWCFKTIIAIDLILRLKCTIKRLVARLRINPLGEHGRFFKPQLAAREWNTPQLQLGAICGGYGRADKDG